MSKLTPMMQQYMEIKERHKDALLLFRLGDFYELFFEDAQTASRELEIALTGRDCGLENRAPMCGVPYHSVDNYIDRLVAKGYKVAICDQVEDASEAKGIVKRDVVRIITPGTLIDTQLLEEKKNNYLMVLYGCEKGWGISYVDLSTGELSCAEILGQYGNSMQRVIDEVTKVQPKEVIHYIVDTLGASEVVDEIREKLDIDSNEPYDGWAFEKAYVVRQIEEHFGVMGIEGLGFSSSDHLAIHSTGALLSYLKDTQKRSLSHINRINIYSLEETMVLDLTTRRNLELTETLRNQSKKGSLLWVLDKTLTAMGGRRLRRWIEQPLLNKVEINRRLDGVEALKEDILFRQELKECLREIYDLERLAGKIAYGTASPKDLVALKNSLAEIPKIKDLMKSQRNSLLSKLLEDINCHEEVRELIHRAILDDPSPSVKEGGIIKDGYHGELDTLHRASKEGKLWIADLEKAEKEKTGIKSLKVGFNKVFGYYIEVTKSNLSMVPDHYIRKQTLANCERYITPELKEIESTVLGAEEKSIALEYELFVKVRNEIGGEIHTIQNTARAIGELDALYSLATVAAENNYVKPRITDQSEISIVEGRHPVVEKMLDKDIFIANDVYLNDATHQLAVITGPNMAGKSTFMRQTALLVLMAQVGSYIPAREATIGIVDRIFTRVGASDDLSQGQSTFMVEMSEMANILNRATSKSLLILDEIGRGTSTFDGLSIAWSIIEFIHAALKAKTLFSTHYHELTVLEGRLEGVKNYRVSVKEDDEDVIFLRKVVEGSADKSYGIQVAKLAGLPVDIISRAKSILFDLENKGNGGAELLEDNGKTFTGNCEVALSREPVEEQLDFTSLYQGEIIEELTKINLLETTPLDALNILYRLQKKASKA